MAEKSDVDIQLLATPGMRDAGISEYAIDKTEDRFDALYIMDCRQNNKKPTKIYGAHESSYGHYSKSLPLIRNR